MLHHFFSSCGNSEFKVSVISTISSIYFLDFFIAVKLFTIATCSAGIVNSGEFGARNDGATPISNRRATSDNVPNFSSIDYN
ncbi:MAG: palindromic element RPE2 domain-containing protein [Rickettsia endosymbiont of Culicoides impunctatus]|uniref:palindromic element RPE2 domain-containing protein n=1 Tax=unclassified Candidatus Tisiphia TaxID=2996318 RepID=UPI001E770A81|nr:MAG: palindromic element RPE2 domain-containing protein [Rickettsia endosymbiont of Culicoides impunctatus]